MYLEYWIEQVNHIDIAPDHAGILMGVTNCVASMSGFLAPYVVGLTVSSPVRKRLRYHILKKWCNIEKIANKCIKI